MRRWARWLTVAALLLVAGCGVPTDASPREIPADRVPFELLDPWLPSSAP
jgi:hypothetical protein